MEDDQRCGSKEIIKSELIRKVDPNIHIYKKIGFEKLKLKNKLKEEKR